MEKNGAIYEFDGFQLVTNEELLLRNGERVPLNIKSFGVLKVLVERHGHLVTKSELMDTVWEDAFVEEGSLAKAVWTIRQALGDTSKEKFIQTVPKRGYRFIFPVSVISDDSGEFRLSNPSRPDQDQDRTAPPEAEPFPSADLDQTAAAVDARGAVEPRRRLPRRAAAAGVVLVIVSIGLYLGFSGRGILSKAEKNRLVVLPLRPLDGQGRDAIYDLGIAEALISKLRADKNLSVRPLDAALVSPNTDEDPIKLGTQQDVDYVLSSHYQLANGKIKVTVKLFDVTSGKVEEDFSATTRSDEPFAAQEMIANDIGNRLLARFGSVSTEYRPDRGTNNEDAYRAYLLAQNFNELRGTENGRNALEQIELAVALDPNFARAWAAKAYIHRYIGFGAGAHEHYRKSMEAVEKALAIEPNLSEAHSALCFNKFRYEYDFSGAEKACRRAVELDPNSPLAHKLYSNFLYSRGRFDEALAEIRTAIDLQPVSYDNQQTYALALYFARKFEDAESQWKRLIPLNPNHGLIRTQLVRTLERQGKDSEALEHLIQWLIIEKQSEETISRFRSAFAMSGWRGVMLERVKLAESRGTPGPFELARYYAALNDKDRAFEYLERSYQERSNMIAVLRVDPELDSLRDDPRFAELLQKVEDGVPARRPPG